MFSKIFSLAWICIRIELKSWIRSRIEGNTDPQPCTGVLKTLQKIILHDIAELYSHNVLIKEAFFEHRRPN
jgi:hypothetical protein